MSIDIPRSKFYQKGYADAPSAPENSDWLGAKWTAWHNGLLSRRLLRLAKVRKDLAICRCIGECECGSNGAGLYTGPLECEDLAVTPVEEPYNFDDKDWDRAIY